MKTLSEEHKANIAKSVKMRWKRGDFNSETIRNKWRETALSGIAKKGRKNPNKFIPSQEMIDDYSKMGDVDLSSKYGVSRRLIIRIRKEYNLPRFNNQHGTYPHEFRDGKEYKWCGSGHWELVENFGIHSSRYDGLRGHCKLHANESANKSHIKSSKTPEGKSRIRIQNHKRRDGYVLWEYEDQVRAFEVYKNRCGYCGTKIDFRSVEFDHLIPISKGGQTVPNNMIPACVKCNRGIGGKRTKDVSIWLTEKFGEDIGKAVLDDILEKQELIGQETWKRVEQALQSLLGE